MSKDILPFDRLPKDEYPKEPFFAAEHSNYEIVCEEKEVKTVFISGAITNDWDNYKEKFAIAEAKLTAMGYYVLNPAWLPQYGFSVEAYMRIDRAMLMECQAIVLLPDWIISDGAKDEFLAATEAGKVILYYEDLIKEEIENV